MLTIREVADKFGVSYWTIRRWVLSGKIKGYKFGNITWRVDEEEVQAFIENHTYKIPEKAQDSREPYEGRGVLVNK